jgi:hypothetical protein
VHTDQPTGWGINYGMYKDDITVYKPIPNHFSHPYEGPNVEFGDSREIRVLNFNYSFASRSRVRLIGSQDDLS